MVADGLDWDSKQVHLVEVERSSLAAVASDSLDVVALDNQVAVGSGTVVDSLDDIRLVDAIDLVD